MSETLNIDHQREVYHRAQDYKNNQRHVQRHCITHGLQMKQIKVEELPNMPNDILRQRAIGLFVASEMKHFEVKGEKVDKSDIAPQFQSLPFQDQREYDIAALLHDPRRKTIYCSNAFVVFLAKFAQKELRGTRQPVKGPEVTAILKEAKGMWRRLDKSEKLPFYLHAYLCTYVPRRMDAACSEYYN